MSSANRHARVRASVGRMATPRTSAGLLPYRVAADGTLEVLIGHMGGPFWAKKDAGAWSVIKGEYDPAEAPEAAARREWAEETGTPVPLGELLALGEVRQRSGKRVTAWAVHAPGIDAAALRSNSFEIEWPPRSGRRAEFPELDRAAWMPLTAAAERIVAGQRPLLDALREQLAGRDRPG